MKGAVSFHSPGLAQRTVQMESRYAVGPRRCTTFSPTLHTIDCTPVWWT